MFSVEQRPKLGISFRAIPKNLPQVEKVAARYGQFFDFISVYDEIGDCSPFLHLLMIARSLPQEAQTWIGPAGIHILKTSPLDVVSQLAVIEKNLPERVFLGVVPGARGSMVGLPTPTAKRVNEYLAVIEYLSSVQTEGFQGDFNSIEPGFRVNFTPPKYPVLLGAWGPKMMAVAAERAEAVQVGSTANPQVIPIIRKRLEAGIKHFNKKHVRLIVGVATVVAESTVEAKQVALQYAPFFLSSIGRSDPTVVAEHSQELSLIEQLVQNGQHDQVRDVLSDELLSKFILFGTPVEIVNKTRQLLDAGADGIEYGVPHHPSDQETGIRLLKELVLPEFR